MRPDMSAPVEFCNMYRKTATHRGCRFLFRFPTVMLAENLRMLYDDIIQNIIFYKQALSNRIERSM